MLEGDKLYGGKPRKRGVRNWLDCNFGVFRRISLRQWHWKDVGESDGHMCKEKEHRMQRLMRERVVGERKNQGIWSRASKEEMIKEGRGC